MARMHNWINSAPGIVCKDCLVTSSMALMMPECPGNAEIDALHAKCRALEEQNADLRKALDASGRASKSGKG